MSIVNNYSQVSLIAQYIPEQGIRFFSEDKEVDPTALDRNHRPSIDFSKVEISHIKETEEVLVRWGFSHEALKKIYDRCGKIEGRDLFFEKLSQCKIKIERIDFSKKGQPKFYAVFQELKGRGGLCEFYKGSSRRGTERAINTFQMPRFCNPAVKALSAVEQPNQHICRLMGWDIGMKVSALGEEDLSKIDIEELSLPIRWKLYKSLLDGLVAFHKAGLVHRDVKAENIVVIKDASGAIEGVKFIDLDTLAKEKESLSWVGSLISASRDQMVIMTKGVRLRSPTALADHKDDIWAVMWVIYDLEKRITSRGRKGLISNGFLDRCNEYRVALRQHHAQYGRNPVILFSYFSNYLNEKYPLGLFEGVVVEGPLDPLMASMGKLENRQRLDGQSLLEAFLPIFKEEALV